MDFGRALQVLRQGGLVAREGWNGRGMFLYLVPGSEFEVSRAPLLGIFGPGVRMRYREHIDMKDATGACVPWLASQTDVLAEDWIKVQRVGGPAGITVERVLDVDATRRDTDHLLESGGLDRAVRAPRIVPTVGRVMWLNTPQWDGQLLAAIVTEVRRNGEVNLCAFSPLGTPFPAMDVRVVQEGEIPPGTGYFATWMPYQLGQAAKTKALEARAVGGAGAAGGRQMGSGGEARTQVGAARVGAIRLAGLLLAAALLGALAAARAGIPEAHAQLQAPVQSSATAKVSCWSDGSLHVTFDPKP